jgi:hypothetical protein
MPSFRQSQVFPHGSFLGLHDAGFVGVAPFGMILFAIKSLEIMCCR